MSKLGICILVIFLAQILYFLRVFSSIPEDHGTFQNCSFLQTTFDITGSEDAVIFSEDILIGAYANLHKVFQGLLPLNQIPNGGFYAVYGIQSGQFKTKPIFLEGFPDDARLLPHGISLYKKGDRNMLFVINHTFKQGGDKIETFQISQEKESGDIVLKYLHSTFMAKKFQGSSNDILFLTENRFLLTSWQVFPIPDEGKQDQPIWQEIVSQLSWVLNINTTYLWDCQYIQGKIANCKRIEDSAGIMNNGIAFDQKDTIMLSDTLGRNIKVFKLNKDDSLQLIQQIPTSIMADNLNYDSKRDKFFLAGMNSPIEYLKLNFLIDKLQQNSSSQTISDISSIVQTISKSKTKQQKYELNNIFSSQKTIAAVSGALLDYSGKFLFLNSFIEKSLVICKNK